MGLSLRIFWEDLWWDTPLATESLETDTKHKDSENTHLYIQVKCKIIETVYTEEMTEKI